LNVLNDETVYWQAGFTAGKASRNHDAGLARMQRDWFTRAKAIEKDGDKAVAEQAYKRGYEEAARA
jgi:hypothetical protein